MKKILSFLVALTLLAATPLALAAEQKLTDFASAFDVTVNVPDGATVDTHTVDNTSYSSITFTDETLPGMLVSIAPSDEETYANRNMKDLSDEERDQLFASITTDMDVPSYQMATSAKGYDYMLIDESNEELDCMEMLAIHDGWFIDLYLMHADYAKLSDDDVAIATALMDSLTIVETAK